MPTRDHQAVPLAHGIGIRANAGWQLVFPAATRPAALSAAEHAIHLTSGVAGLHTAEKQRSLQVEYASEPPGSDASHNQGFKLDDSMCQWRINPAYKTSGKDGIQSVSEKWLTTGQERSCRNRGQTTRHALAC